MTSVLPRTLCRNELLDLLRQVQQDGAGFEYGNRRDRRPWELWSTIAGMRLLGEMARKSGLNCSPVADVDRHQAVRQRGLLQEHRDLVAIGRRPIVQIDHRVFLRRLERHLVLSQNSDVDILLARHGAHLRDARAGAGIAHPGQHGLVELVWRSIPAIPERAGARRRCAPPCCPAGSSAFRCRIRPSARDRVAALHDFRDLETGRAARFPASRGTR